MKCCTEQMKYKMGPSQWQHLPSIPQHSSVRFHTVRLPHRRRRCPLSRALRLGSCSQGRAGRRPDHDLEHGCALLITQWLVSHMHKAVPRVQLLRTGARVGGCAKREVAVQSMRPSTGSPGRKTALLLVCVCFRFRQGAPFSSMHAPVQPTVQASTGPPAHLGSVGGGLQVSVQPPLVGQLADVGQHGAAQALPLPLRVRADEVHAQRRPVLLIGWACGQGGRWANECRRDAHSAGCRWMLQQRQTTAANTVPNTVHRDIACMQQTDTGSAALSPCSIRTSTSRCSTGCVASRCSASPRSSLACRIISASAASAAAGSRGALLGGASNRCRCTSPIMAQQLGQRAGRVAGRGVKGGGHRG